MNYLYALLFQDKVIGELQDLVKKFESESEELNKKVVDSEKSFADLEAVLKASEEQCEKLQKEKQELDQVCVLYLT